MIITTQQYLWLRTRGGRTYADVIWFKNKACVEFQGKDGIPKLVVIPKKTNLVLEKYYVTEKRCV